MELRSKQSKDKQEGVLQTKTFPDKRKKKINKMKSQPMEWKKIFENHPSDKRLNSKIY